MAADLRRNYDTAVVDATARGVLPQARALETLLQQSFATLNVDAKLFRNMASSQSYLSYYKAMDLGLRKIAEARYHADRGAVDEKIHPGYRAEIVNAALSADGNGLTNYGAITLELESIAIEDRASVMRENSFDFYERNDLGRRGAEEASGWRSVWNERSRLGFAHLAPALTPVTATADLARSILLSGVTRQDDRYMEVHIFGELSWQSVTKATLEKPLIDQQDRDAWDFGRQKFARRGITVVDRTRP